MLTGGGVRVKVPGTLRGSTWVLKGLGSGCLRGSTWVQKGL